MTLFKDDVVRSSFQRVRACVKDRDASFYLAQRVASGIARFKEPTTDENVTSNDNAASSMAPIRVAETTNNTRAHLKLNVFLIFLVSG